jgi:hypothetical protein
MDPYLETPKLWPAFQHQLLACLYQNLLPVLVDRYRARVGTRTYVAETPLFTSVIREQHTEEYLEIRDRQTGNLITLVEVVSPANKTTAAGRSAYLNARQLAILCRAAVVEIDLVKQGQPLLNYSRENLPEHDYTITVTRAYAPNSYEIYTASLQRRLPKFKLPLATSDRDALLDLQAAFARAYDHGSFVTQIDYKQPPPVDVPLSEEQKAWIDDLLRRMNLR